MFALISPVQMWMIKARYWLFKNGYVWLAIHLPQVLYRTLIWGMAALWFGEIVREIRYLWILPKRARQLATRGQNEQAIALMRRCVSAFTPLLGTRPLYFTRAYSLAKMLENAGRYGEASDVWRDLAGRRGLKTGFEATVRSSWANCLENEGDLAGAAQQRALVQGQMETSENAGQGENWSILLEQGKRARDANHFSEAQQLFERALDAPKFGLLARQRDALEAEIACYLALAAHQNGDSARTESAARQSVENADSPFMRSQGLRTLALTLSDQNRLDEALDAARRSLRESEIHGDEHIIADGHAQYAMLLTNMGQVEAAIAECETAIAMGLHESRMALHTLTNCHALRGDYAQARAWLDRARRSQPVATPAIERQMQALFDFEGAGIEQKATKYNDENRAQTAWDLLQRAKPGLNGFDRLLLWLRASEVSTLALLGQTDAARAGCAPLADELENYSTDTLTRNAIWTYLAQTQMQLEAWSEAASWWQTYLQAPFGRPVYRAEALCELGVCHQKLGDKNSAQKCWEQVVELDFAIAATGRARAHLEAIIGDT